LKQTIQSNGLNLIKGMQNALLDFQHTQKPESEFQIGVSLAATTGKVVFRNHLIELIQYSPTTEQTYLRPLLVVPAWIMKYYILDLAPGKSLVKYLVDDGFTVFMISWKNPDASDRDLSMEDYRKAGFMAAIDVISTITHAKKINALGYCLGGTLLAITAATMAREQDNRLASITLLASQVDFTEPGELSLFIDESQINFLEASMSDQGFLDTRQMAGAFQLIRSNDLIWSRRLNQYLLGLSEPANELMTWNADATRMPYRMHSDYLRQLFYTMI